MIWAAAQWRRVVKLAMPEHVLHVEWCRWPNNLLVAIHLLINSNTNAIGSQIPQHHHHHHRNHLLIKTDSNECNLITLAAHLCKRIVIFHGQQVKANKSSSLTVTIGLSLTLLILFLYCSVGSYCSLQCQRRVDKQTKITMLRLC